MDLKKCGLGVCVCLLCVCLFVVCVCVCVLSYPKLYWSGSVVALRSRRGPMCASGPACRRRRSSWGMSRDDVLTRLDRDEISLWPESDMLSPARP